MDSWRPRKRGPNGAQTLEKGLLLLDLLARAEVPPSLSALAHASGLPPSTTHRLLSVLTQRGFVHQDPKTRHYRPGTRAVFLSARVLQQLDLTREAPAILQRFVEATGEGITLAVLEDGELVPLCKAEAPASPRLFLHIGRRAPVHCTALGKVLLAAMPPSEAQKILVRRGTPRMTPQTIVSPKKLLGHLSAVRHQGYAVDDEETVVGGRCLAAPVRNYLGEVVAAVSTSGPVHTWTHVRMAYLREALLESAQLLSERLGYQTAVPAERGS